jgi:hypothetical protein
MNKLIAGILLVFTGISAYGFYKHNPVHIEPIVYLFQGTQAVELKSSGVGGKKLIKKQLIVEPGLFDIDGKTYLVSEGLLRVVRPGGKNDQRIVYAQDVDKLLSSISWIHSHGNRDDGFGYKKLNRLASRQKLYLTCGIASQWINQLLTQLGVESRIVTTLTLGTLNKFDNGHTMVEVKRNGKWELYDFDNANYFVHGHRLSLAGFLIASQTGEYDIHKLSLSTVDGKLKVVDDYDYTFYLEAVSGDIKGWYKRVAQVGMIEKEGKFYFPDIPDRNKVIGYSPLYIPIPDKEFSKTFYN